MTREETIAELNVLHERLSNPKDCEDGCYSWEDGWYVEAIDMAIEALSAPTDKDAVSRQGLLESWNELSPRGRTEFDQVIMTIPALPSADRPTKHTLPDGTEVPIDEESYEIGYTEGQMADRPTGEWLVGDAWPHNVYCSNCYTTFAQEHWEVWEDGSLPRKFCPNCGAKMNKGGDEE